LPQAVRENKRVNTRIQDNSLFIFFS